MTKEEKNLVGSRYTNLLTNQYIDLYIERELTKLYDTEAEAQEAVKSRRGYYYPVRCNSSGKIMWARPK